MSSVPFTLAESEDTAEQLVELHFPARADHLKLVRSSILAAAAMCGFDYRSAQSIVLAIDEACQNVIVHGYGGSADGVLILGLFRCDDGIMVRLRDFAPRVDPAKIKQRALNDIRPGKLGSHFIREIMDTVDFRLAPTGEGNLLEMTKHTGEPQ
jgi:sigma-B regulation protein RsbU (phosphoserine phosphatase)